MSNNLCKIRFGTFGEIQLGYYSINELDLVEHKPGWYSWHFVPDRSEDLNSGLFRVKSIDAEVKSIFGTKYSGRLNTHEIDIDSNVYGKYSEFIEQTFICFSPPLYIGISKDVKFRLNTHKSKLYGTLELGIINKVKELDLTKIDSVEESSYFGQRIGNRLIESNIDKNGLFVKVIYSESESELKPVEKILNNFFIPPYGRR